MLKTQRAFVQLNPSQDEARAALYNKGCCHAQMEQWAEAAEAVQQACNNYGLRLAVAIEASCGVQWQQNVQPRVLPSSCPGVCGCF